VAEDLAVGEFSLVKIAAAAVNVRIGISFYFFLKFRNLFKWCISLEIHRKLNKALKILKIFVETLYDVLYLGKISNANFEYLLHNLKLA
jgi:hypothetical protein